jgi:Uma2 family endonuclease
MNPRSMSGSLPHGPTPPRGEDLPSDDGEPMETQRHRRQMNVLADSLDDAWTDRDDVFVGGNMAVYFSETQARRNDFRGPDVFVVLDTKRRERKSWVVWEEEGRTPDVVIELVSESTEEVDRGPKKDIYARLLHVAVYVIYDPFSAQLEAYRLDAAHRRYVGIEPDSRGRIFVEPLGLWLAVIPSKIRGIEAPWLRWVDRNGRVFPYGPDEFRRAAEERARATEEELARLRKELKR